MDKIFKALADVNRRRILTILNKNGELTVTALLKNFSITQATLSNHLAILRKANLVNSKVKGQSRLYSINYPVLKIFVTQLSDFVKEATADTIQVRKFVK